MNSFRLSTQAIEAPTEVAALADPALGACATFEGWVRNQNEGRVVSRLDYEAFESLACAEGQRILQEACLRFDITAVRCVHRVGELPVGELAVWVGAASPHRAEAFAACRYIIDEVKHRLPIWKKEHYLDGDAHWVNCEQCATAPSAHAQFSYLRQESLPEVGPEGQQRLATASVLVIGAGGLGCPVLSILAGAGVGHLHIVDGDTVEASNLHRQPLYTMADVGRPKAVCAAQRLAAYNPGIKISAHTLRFTADNAASLLQQADLVIDCGDNFATQFLVNDAAMLAGKPAILASVHQYEGQLQVVRADRQGACLRCLWPEGMRDGVVGSCSDNGVLGAVPATLGAMQAMEALKILLDLPGQMQDEVLLLDLLSQQQQRLKISRPPACTGRACATINAIEVSTEDSKVELHLSLKQAIAQGYSLVDIREPYEVSTQPMLTPDVLFIPTAQLLADDSPLTPGRKYLLICAHGVRSLMATEQLRQQGRRDVWSLSGGLAQNTN